MKYEDEVEDMASKADTAVVEASANGGSKFPGMTYEDGVQAALDWVLGNSDVDPLA